MKENKKKNKKKKYICKGYQFFCDYYSKGFCKYNDDCLSKHRYKKNDKNNDENN